MPAVEKADEEDEVLQQEPTDEDTFKVTIETKEAKAVGDEVSKETASETPTNLSSQAESET